MIKEITHESLLHASQILRSGELCAFPTETVYGLGGNALCERAVRRIYEMKGRPAHNPLIVHVPDVGEAQAICAAWPESAHVLATRFWPGPLTLVLPRKDCIPAVVSAGLPTVAVRAPAHPGALALLNRCGLPLAAPSANRSERLSPTTARHVKQSLPDLGLILDGGPCRLGIESTVVDLSVSPPRLLRPGALPLFSLLPHLPELSLAPTIAVGAAHPSPGMMERHYAPRARLLLCGTTIPQLDVDAVDLAALPQPVGLLLYRPTRVLGDHACELLPGDPSGYAADLYAALHRLDDRGVRTVVAQDPPAGDAWAAIRDRLRRASV